MQIKIHLFIIIKVEGNNHKKCYIQKRKRGCLKIEKLDRHTYNL